jgi:hypothetical protein
MTIVEVASGIVTADFGDRDRHGQWLSTKVIFEPSATHNFLGGCGA